MKKLLVLMLTVLMLLTFGVVASATEAENTIVTAETELSSTLANGAKKWDILQKALYGKITPFVPASILQLHPNVTVVYSEN